MENFEKVKQGVMVDHKYFGKGRVVIRNKSGMVCCEFIDAGFIWIDFSKRNKEGFECVYGF